MRSSGSTNDHHAHHRYASENMHTPPWELTAKIGISDATRTPSSAADRDVYADDNHHASVPRQQYSARAPTYHDIRRSPTLASECYNANASVPDATRPALTGPPSSRMSPHLSDSSGTSSGSFDPQRIQAFPGTMSARHESQEYTHIRRSKGHDDVEESTEDPDRQDTGKLKRMKSAFRSFFKKRHVDERQFETISGRHWADDSD
ncbi:uncharacterized protein MYCGRDRAFT_108829 [Zymoseptoria tritici IPO323]|uniref:Uncharacterized protein n=3 Tax=Zymoseptoria tritici TaxID=1047171 RepID=F9X6E7_ZYMTI|nr:uncharacterized protein MYCGRDRAFT_108829 [Zymoseptoria tritici IPO323]EGP89207.1 hypothetical protein MYCGRDRAFT_108829 [Zymoseptoria tritici IPO323]